MENNFPVCKVGWWLQHRSNMSHSIFWQKSNPLNCDFLTEILWDVLSVWLMLWDVCLWTKVKLTFVSQEARNQSVTKADNHPIFSICFHKMVCFMLSFNLCITRDQKSERNKSRQSSIFSICFHKMVCFMLSFNLCITRDQKSERNKSRQSSIFSVCFHKMVCFMLNFNWIYNRFRSLNVSFNNTKCFLNLCKMFKTLLYHNTAYCT